MDVIGQSESNGIADSVLCRCLNVVLVSDQIEDVLASFYFLHVMLSTPVAYLAHSYILI